MKVKTDNTVYFTEKVRNDLFHVLEEVVYFSITRFDRPIKHAAEEIVGGMDVREEYKDRIYPTLVWWKVFCSPSGSEGLTIFQRYLQLNKHKWRNKPAYFQEMLASWMYLNPGFYRVEDDESISGRVFVFKDVFEQSTKLITLFQKNFQTPKRGELISGLLIPIGHGKYISPGKLFHIPEQEAASVIEKITPYFEKHHESPHYRFNPQLYPSMITMTLESVGDSQ
ncbi:hypothetical protein [Lentibacillus sediminis]|uniref:hypothetical protein n=1 Tax=Lentibacillus sediminis TaxID=1940529 RepID=UPI000C1BBBE7|nr:hypothetical protein [Lentibacillus sediminis]